MSKHTPAPWVIDPEDRQDVVPASNPDGVGIAVVQRIDHNGNQWVWGEQSEANARLIAAAPDLLEALEGVERLCSQSGYVGVNGQYLKVVRAAIAKARMKT